ncbi:DUF4336 domain-containing protein [Sphingomonas sp. QA11]|uniref:DUF4336 domain-containing protein n=1 Tax=Sphingomonas sp. QA11 TaxID=2950605 RepID=UPI002349C0F6|nr:DUF4336 domain-containing protein [Sphingomonas sp. QA11]WCM25811.1 DUF4336 domain-containing protein [Sphingomonas sp. QA11]
MAVIRLAGGDLFIWSPTALTEGLRAAVESLGTVSHLIAPNSLHHLFLADWKRAFPEARLHAPPGLWEKRRDLAFDHDLADGPMQNWAGEIDQVVMRGNVITTEVVFFHVPSGTVLFTDLLQQLSASRFSGWRALVARWDLMTGPEPAVPRKFRLAFTDRRAARAAIGHVLSWPAKRVLMAHGTPVSEDGRALIRRAFRWLSR